jgi:ABC-type transport system involved in multi-copper enzyme maturation permease subunit
MKKFIRILNIASFTISDELHNRSFFILLAVCMLMVLGIRGCYRSEYVVNGQSMDGLTVAWHTSVIAYHAIVIFGLFASMILSSRVLRRDKDNGTMSFILSRPVSRLEYTTGKVLGIWLLTFLFMFVLHATVFIMTLTVSGGMLPMFPVASLLCGLDILLCVCLFAFLSMTFPEFLSLVIGVAVLAIGYFSDSFHAVMHSRMLQSALSQTGAPANFDASWWRIVWPKAAALQFYGSALIKGETFTQMGPLNPVINVAVWAIILFTLLAWKMRWEEV